jgi:Predicted dienelactone hydrolase
MKVRHMILLAAMAGELLLFFYCLLRKSNHVPAGYICALLSFVLLICTGWLLLFPKVAPVEATGEHRIRREDCFYTDTSRIEAYADDGSYRELPVSFWYPADCPEPRSCPLVVFSHGSFGMKNSNETLYRELASHGYVVCAIDHTYQCFSTKLSNGKTVRLSRAFMKEIAADSPQDRPEQSLPHFENWMKIRTGDINFVLDTLIEMAAEERGEGSVYDLFDVSRICVMGHSLGGSAALGVGRQRDDIAAVISLEAPFICDIQSVDADGNYIFAQAEYPVPVLNIYSDASWEHLKEWKQYAENARLLEMESDDICNVHLSGAGHFSLTDLSLSSPFLTFVFDGFKTNDAPRETLKKINRICLSFLDEHMK